MMNLAFALRCKRTTRRLQRYLDMDPVANLSETDIAKVRSHIAECERCCKSVADHKKIRTTLRLLGESHALDELSISRLKAALDQIDPGQK
jgi:anti-sigma factor RsiW